MSVWVGMELGRFSCESPTSTGLGEERKVQVGREPEWIELCVYLASPWSRVAIELTWLLSE